MSYIDGYRVEQFRKLDASAQNKSMEIILECNDNFHPKAEDFAFDISYACNFCNLTDVEILWQDGVCDIPPTEVYNSIVYVLYITILVFAMIGNSLIIYVVYTNYKMRTVTNYFIANLAAGDLFMAIFCVPFSFISTLILQYWPFGVHLCVTVNYLQSVSVFVSAYSLVAISMDRYRAIISPLRPRMTRFHAKVIIVVIWVMSLLTTLPIAICSTLLNPPIPLYIHKNLWVCTEDWGDSTVMQELRATYSVGLMLLQYILPLVVLFFTYSRLCLVVWAKRTQIGETPARLDKIEKSRVKMIKMMVTVVLVYTLCWLPFNVLMVVREHLPTVDSWPHMKHLWTAFHWLAMSHTCYNPLILGWMNTKFRSGFRQVISSFPCCPNISHDMNGHPMSMMSAMSGAYTETLHRTTSLMRTPSKSQRVFTTTRRPNTSIVIDTIPLQT
ncbi:unnamed protein product, partial [Meganyctiphanes norvegica]